MGRGGSGAGMRGLGRWWIVAVVTGGLLFAGIVVFVRNPAREPESSVELAVLPPAIEPDEDDGPNGRVKSEEDEGSDPSEEDAADRGDRGTETGEPAISVSPYVVVEGDSLSLIASRAYDAVERQRGAHWLVIYAFNVAAGVIDPVVTPIVIDGDEVLVRIEPGVELTIPHYSGQFPPIEPILSRWGIAREMADGEDGGPPRVADADASGLSGSVGMTVAPYVPPVRRGPEGTPRWTGLQEPTVVPPRERIASQVEPAVTGAVPPATERADAMRVKQQEPVSETRGEVAAAEPEPQPPVEVVAATQAPAPQQPVDPVAAAPVAPQRVEDEATEPVPQPPADVAVPAPQPPVEVAAPDLEPQPPAEAARRDLEPQPPAEVAAPASEPQPLAEVAPRDLEPQPPAEVAAPASEPQPLAEVAPREPEPPPSAEVVAPEPEPPLLAEAEAPPPPPPPPPAEIRLTEPLGSTFYRDTLTIAGSVRVAAPAPTPAPGPDTADVSRGRTAPDDLIPLDSGVERLTAFFAGQRDEAQPVYWDVTTGEFRISLNTARLRGRQTLVLEAETDQGVVSQVTAVVFDGNTPPTITLTAPDLEWGYGAFIEIAGRAVDATADAGQPRGVEVIRYEILPSDFAVLQEPLEGEIRPDPDGSFSHVIPASDLRGTQMVALVARSVSGAEGELLFDVPPADTAIPRVAATAASGEITIDWSTLPGERTYAIWYREVRPGEPEGDPGAEVRLWEDLNAQVIPGVVSPWTVTGLDNGRRYRFQVVSGTEGREAWSEAVENIPLTGDEFGLTVTNDFDGIFLRWNPIAAAGSYAIWRREDGEEEFVRLAVLSEREYRDEGVRYGVRYAYRVTPDLPGATGSDVAYGQAAAVPQEAMATIAASPAGNATAVTVAGEYVVVGYDNGVALVDIWDAPRIVQRGAVTGLSGVRSLAGWSRYVFVAERAGLDGSTGRIRILDTENSSRPRVVFTSPSTPVEELAVVPTASSVLVFAAAGRGGTMIYALEERPVGLRLLTTVRRRESRQVAALADASSPEGVLLATSDNRRLFLQSVTSSGVVDPRGSVGITGVSDLDVIADASGQPLILATTATDLVVVAPASVPGGELEVVSRTPIAGATSVRGASYEDGTIFVYVGSAAGGVTVLDLTDPGAPIQFAGSGGGQSVLGLALHRAITGEVTVATATDEGTAFFEAHTIGRSRNVATVVTPGDARRVRVVPASGGDRALIIDTTGVTVEAAADIVRRRSADRTTARYFSAGGSVSGADVLGGAGRELLLVADRENGLFAFDLTDPSAPITHLSADMQPLDVIAEARAGGARLGYVLDERWGLIMVDFSIPEEPVQRSATRVPAPRDFARIGSTVFIADAERGLVVIDATDPDFPREVYAVDLPGALAVDAHRYPDGSLVAIVALTDRFVVLTSDAAGDTAAGDPAGTAGSLRLVRRGEYLSRFAESVQVDDEYALLGEGILGLNILDLSDPDRPRRISGSDLPYATSVAREGEYVLATDGTDLQVVEILIPPWLEYATSNR
jgi:hypothetical protein